MPNNDQLDGRLRSVETDVAAIKERISHMPTTASLWKALALAAGSVLAAFLGGGWWVVQRWLEPILARLG
jgi:hypothetical protein